MNIGEFVTHPIADAWPLMDGEEFKALVEDMREHGQLNKIWRWKKDDSIIDGRNRLRGCLELGIKPRFEYYDGDDVLGFIRAQNDHRRHMSWSVRCIVAARLATLSRGRRAKSGGAAGLSQAAAGDELDVKERSVRAAAALLKTAVPELVAAFEHEDLGLEVAGELAKLEPAQQLAALKKHAAIKAERARDRAATKEAKPPANTNATEKVEPRVQLLRIVMAALTKAGGSVMLEPKGAHVAFHGDVFLLQLTQQPKRGEKVA